jgi:hypothetical protein
MYLGLTLVELMEVVRTCNSVELDRCTPPYLQEFITKRLEGEFAGLATKVRQLSAKQMDALCEYITITHRLIRK